MNDIVMKSNENECKGIGKGGMPRLKINIGHEYNWLTVLSECPSHERPKGITDFCYYCRCRCGTTVITTSSNLKSGHRKSCGCINRNPKYNIKAGDRFGKLTVIRRVDMSERTGRRKKSQYACSCDCGNITQVLGRNLVSGGTKSCGCGLVFNKRYKGFFGQFPLVLLNHYRIMAERRSLKFEVSPEYLNCLYEKQKGRCALSGLKIGFGPKTKSTSSTTASLDRIDNRLGYIRGNVWWVHKDINVMKLDHSMKYFVSLCKKVSEYNK